MEKSKYFKIRNLAWEVLVKHKADKLPINIVQICNNMGITVRRFKGDFDGYNLERNNNIFIFYNEDIKNPGRIRFTIAHELGHILLNQFELTYEEKEKEADMFAARILVPLGVIQEIGVTSPEEIMKLCKVSYTVASKRYDRLLKVRPRNKFKTNKLEKQLVKNFSNFINQYKRLK